MISTREIIKTRTSSIFLRDEGLIEMRMLPDLDIDAKDVEAQYAAFRKLTNKNPFLLIVFPGKGTQITSEGRAYCSKHGKDNGIIAQAVITDDLVHRLLSRIFIKLNNPHQSIKLFKYEKDAMDWLYTFR